MDDFIVNLGGTAEVEAFVPMYGIKAFYFEKKERIGLSKGRFGVHGGQYVPEIVMNALIELEQAYEKHKNDPDFTAELEDLLKKLRRASVHAVLCRKNDEGPGRGQDISQA